jgi:hypothetical protein
MQPTETNRQALQLYAELAARLCHPLADRVAVLSLAGLDEQAWIRLESYCLGCLTAEEESAGTLAALFCDGFARARARAAARDGEPSRAASTARTPGATSSPADIIDLMRTIPLPSEPATPTSGAWPTRKQPEDVELMGTLPSPTEARRPPGSE